MKQELEKLGRGNSLPINHARVSSFGGIQQWLFIAQLFSTVAMTGLIWFVQLVHYPLFLLVPDPHHAAYAAKHQRHTGWVVGPLMLVELATSCVSLLPPFRLPGTSQAGALTGVILIAVIWLSTALLQVPIHGKLLVGMHPASIRRLVLTNWVRTAAWSLRSLLLLGWLLRRL